MSLLIEFRDRLSGAKDLQLRHFHIRISSSKHSTEIERMASATNPWALDSIVSGSTCILCVLACGVDWGCGCCRTEGDIGSDLRSFQRAGTSKTVGMRFRKYLAITGVILHVSEISTKTLNNVCGYSLCQPFVQRYRLDRWLGSSRHVKEDPRRQVNRIQLLPYFENGKRRHKHEISVRNARRMVSAGTQEIEQIMCYRIGVPEPEKPLRNDG